MRCLSIAFASKALLNLSNFLVYSLLALDKSINVESFLPDIWMLHLTTSFCHGSSLGRQSEEKFLYSSSKYRQPFFYRDIITTSLGPRKKTKYYISTTQRVCLQGKFLTSYTSIQSHVQQPLVGSLPKGVLFECVYKKVEGIRPCSYYCQRTCLVNN